MDFTKLDEFIDSQKSLDGALIAVSHQAQELYGYLSEEVQKHIAKRLNIPASKVYGVVTFYSFFNTKPKGKYTVNVCLGTACFVRGADKVLDAFKEKLNIDVGGTTDDGLFTLDSVRCVGACGLAPVVSINGEIHGNMTAEKVGELVEQIRRGE